MKRFLIGCGKTFQKRKVSVLEEVLKEDLRDFSMKLSLPKNLKAVYIPNRAQKNEAYSYNNPMHMYCRHHIGLSIF